MITIADLKRFWDEDLDDDAETIAMIVRIRHEGFSEDVPFHIAEAMKAWATSDPGPTACYFADKVKSGLLYHKTADKVSRSGRRLVQPNLTLIQGGMSNSI